MKKSLIALLFAGFWLISLSAQIQNDIEQFEETNGKGYIKPLAEAMGANLNSGLFASAKVLKPLKFRLTFNSMAAFIPTKDKIFTAVRPALQDPMSGTPLYSPDEIESATVFGNEGGQFNFSGDPLHFTNEDDIKLPDGLNITAAPLLIPQISFGLFGGNEIMFRYFPKVELDPKIGDLSFYGFAFKHGLNRSLLKLLPFDLALQVAYHSFTLGDILQIKSFSANAQAGKKIFHWTFFGGMGWETTNLHAHYVSEAHLEIGGQYPYYSVNPVPTDIEFDIKGINRLRVTIGIAYQISIFNLNVAYSLEKYAIADLGIGVSF